MSTMRQERKEIIKFSRLVHGDTVGILALSSPMERDRFERGLCALKKRGFNVKIGLDPCAEYGKTTYLFSSDTPQSRAEALHQMFLDSSIRAILAARGAYGAMELLPHLDFDLIREYPKGLIGFSDTTCILVALYSKAGLVTMHGPSLDSCLAKIEDSPEAQSSFEALLRIMSGMCSDPFGEMFLDLLCGGGAAEGPLIGGNLSMLSSLMGTPWEPEFDGHILFIEEYAEAPYRIHRMLLQMKLAGKFNRVRGVVLGHLSSCVQRRGLGPNVEEAIKDIFSEFNIPVLSGAPFGHELLNLPVPLGVRASIEKKRFRILEPVVAL